jgi:hypothetical protein
MYLARYTDGLLVKRVAKTVARRPPYAVSMAANLSMYPAGYIKIGASQRHFASDDRGGRVIAQ